MAPSVRNKSRTVGFKAFKAAYDNLIFLRLQSATYIFSYSPYVLFSQTDFYCLPSDTEGPGIMGSIDLSLASICTLNVVFYVFSIFQSLKIHCNKKNI